MAQLKRFVECAQGSNVLDRSGSYALSASQKRARLLTGHFLKAYNDKNKVAFRNVLMPTEIFYALDIIPFCVETACALMAVTDVGQSCLAAAESKDYSRDICSFSRCTAGAAILDILPTPDVLCCTSYYCDDSSKLFYALSEAYDKRYFHFDIPYRCDDQSISYVEMQLRKLTEHLEKDLQVKMDQERLSETIRLSNEARNYFIRVNELRTHAPAPLAGSEAIDYAALLSSTWGSREIVDVYKMLYEEVSEQVARLKDHSHGRKSRILWRHLRPYYSEPLFAFVENECGAEIAFEEVNHVYWDEMDPEDPYRSLAKRLLMNPAVGDFSRWLKVTLDLIEAYQIDGVISFNHWGCKQLCSGEGILRDILRDRSVPMIQLGGDCIDRRDFSFAQLKTRIQAFLEMMTGGST